MNVKWDADMWRRYCVLLYFLLSLEMEHCEVYKVVMDLGVILHVGG